MKHPAPLARMLYSACLLSIALTSLASPALAQTIPNPSFELNPIFTNFPGYSDGNAAITGWTSNNPARTGLNPGSDFFPFADNGVIPNGARVALLQSVSGAVNTLSTTITGLTAGTWYRVQFRVNSRAATSAPSPSYRINGGAAVAFAAPCVDGFSTFTNPYHTVSAIFQATATTAPLEISNSTSGDTTVLLDDFKITAATPIVVANNADSGAGSLRAALATANSGANATNFNVITFASVLNGGTITLSSEILVNDASGVAIDASALSNGITLHGGSGTNRVLHHAAGSVAALRKLTLTSGNPFFGDGGGIFNEGILSVTQCAIKENTTANGGGGGVGNDAAGTISLSQCTLSGNLGADDGGGGLANSGTAFLSQCTFSGNDSYNFGSAMYNAGKMTLKHVTIANNVDNFLGTTPGMTNYAQLEVESCIFAGNQVGDLVNSGGTLTRSGSNIIRVFSQSGGTNSGPAAITSDPLLTPLASNGGPTQTMGFSTSSPARNAAVGSTITTDQRGLPVVSTPDLGAFEMQGNSGFTLGATTPAFEGGVAEIVINRNGNISGVSKVRLFTTTGSAGAADFTARPNTAASDVTFLDGETTKTVAIPLIADNLAEGNEAFTVTLSSPTPAGATVPVGAAASATVTIKNAYLVSNLSDSGGGSLRQALVEAALNPGPDAVGFAPALAFFGSPIFLVGGEIVVNDPAPVIIDASSIGGITIDGNNFFRLFSVNANANLTLRRLTLTGGNTGGDGGALLNAANATTVLIQCTLTNNHAVGNGGAVCNTGGTGSLTLKQCTVANNTAALGGGIYSNTAPGQPSQGTSLDRCTITGNTGTTGGGGIRNRGGVTTILHCTITGNTATNNIGHEVLSFSDANTETVVDKSIISGNNTPSVDVDGGSTNTFTSAGGNVIGPGGAAADFNQAGDLISNTPLLGGLGDYGGPTKTCALSPGSPALNRASGSPITSDQRGFMINGIADSGAFEAGQGGSFGISTIGSTFGALEGQPFAFVIERTRDFVGPASVRFYTTNGTATGGTDFTARPNTTASDVLFGDGEVSKTVLIPTVADTVAEPNETLIVALGSPSPLPLANALGGLTSVAVSIVDPIIVTNVNDDGPGSLRQAFRTAATNARADVIKFAPALNGQTITLGGQLVVNDAVGVTVDASNLTAGLTIDAGPGRGHRVMLVGVNVATNLTLRCLTLTGGFTVGDFGAAILHLAGTLTLERCTLFGNISANGDLDGYGGAIHNQDTAKLTQCTLSGNSAGGSGGAISNIGNLTLTHCTFVGNSCGSQGGAVLASNLTLERCVFSGNNCVNSPAGSDIDGGTATLVGTSFVPNNAATLVTTNGSISTDDPLLDPKLANNGGPTKTHALLAGSPAIDAGAGSTVTIDQRGRPIISAADLGAYEVQLGGTFALNRTSYSATEGSSDTITIYRTGNLQGTASVRLITTAGTASAGEFTPRPNDDTSVVNFGDGEGSQGVIVFINQDSLPEANEYFTLSLVSPSAGCTIGSPASAKLAIVDNDSPADTLSPPAPVISTPAAGAALNVDLGGTITVTGTATDNRSVLLVRLYDAATNTLLASSALDALETASTGWTATITPVTGVNSIYAVAGDVAFNGPDHPSIVRTFKVLRPMQVGISGVGSVTSGFVGKSYREVGKPYTITATAGTGAFFTGWTIGSHNAAQIGLTASALEKNAITFIHREGLGIAANFIPNPYTTAVAGIYNGGISPSISEPPSGGSGPGDVGTASRLDTEGYISVKVETTGAFSGSMKIDGALLPVAGTFDAAGVARFGTSRATSLSVARTGKPSLIVSLSINTGTKKITGTVAQLEGITLAAVSDVDADRAFYSATNPVPATAFSATALRPATGTYTLTSFVADANGLPNEQVPGGTGYGTVTLSANGAITVTAKLTDGTVVTQSTTVSQTGKWRLFAQLYPGLQGLLADNVTFDHSSGFSDFVSVNNGPWICPLQDRQHYPFGWPNGILTTTFGCKYTIEAGKSVVQISEIPTTGGDGNSDLGFFGGSLSSSINNHIEISPTDAVTQVNPNPLSPYTLTINRTTGAISGTFRHSDGTTVPYNGVVFQKGLASNRAYGYFLTTSPAVKDYTGKSGGVGILRQ